MSAKIAIGTWRTSVRALKSMSLATRLSVIEQGIQRAQDAALDAVHAAGARATNEGAVIVNVEITYEQP